MRTIMTQISFLFGSNRFISAHEEQMIFWLLVNVKIQFNEKKIRILRLCVFLNHLVRIVIIRHSYDIKMTHWRSWTMKEMSRRMGKPTFCIGENKGADQLRSNCEADQCLCFRYSYTTVLFLLKSEISSY